MPVKRPLAFAACVALSLSAQVEEPRPVVALQTSMGVVRAELYPEVAPKTVANFLVYVNSGFYDDTVFHRVIEGFVVQGGGFTPELIPKPTRKPVRIETKNGMSNERGTVAMARQMGKDTASSQFFINLKPNTTLDRGALRFGYTVFGRVIEGMDVVDRISRVQTSRRGRMHDVPILPVFLETARVE
ncbi:MAG: peptidylprolyl isomerase A [Acidobacteriia bacterium]|nr:peptidylprolyl isomerase A [Terriglobia bacterium]MYC65768.1 peptidylprolyl isomerase A [Terriglobia bacterium]